MPPHNTRSIFRLGPALALVTLFVGGCPEDTDDGEAEANNAGTDGGAPACEYCSECASNEQYLRCMCEDNFGVFSALGSCPGYCVSNAPQFDFDCNSACSGPSSFTQQLVCEETHVGQSCASWSPSSEVTLTAGVYHVDQAFVDNLVADPNPLAACDDGYFLGGTSTFKVRGAASGELLYELGLRNNDVVQTFNGTYINSIADVMAVFTRDYLTRGLAEYELKVNRSGTIVTLSYEIDP